MSTGRPAPVVAHLRRPLGWVPVLAAILALVLATAVADARSQERRRDRSLDVQGTLVDRRTGDGRAKVTYVHPVTEQELTVTMEVWDRDRLPAAPGPVPLDADPDDPDGVRLDGDVSPATSELGWNLPYLAVPLLVWLRRRWGVRRSERLMAGPGPSFAMLGAIAPVGWRGRRTELHLWPLDAAPGAPSLCRVGLLATAHLSLGGTVFNVEVKGRPRPFGRLAARSPDTGGLLWPAGAVLPRRPRPRPAATVVPATLPAEVSVAPSVAMVRPPWAAIGSSAVVVVGGGLLFLLVAALTTHGAAQASRVQDGRRVVAEVTGRDDRADRIELTFSIDGERRTGRAPADYVEDFTVGRRYPATVDPQDPGRLRLARARYDVAAPLLWAAIVPLAGLLLVGRLLHRWLGAVRLARRGGWRPFELRTGHRATSWCTLVDPATGQVVGSPRFDLPGPPTSAVGITALVAGDPQPGGRAVVHFSGSTKPAARIGAAPRLKWWDP